MKAWKKLEIYIREYLEWTRITKKHYGDSCPDLKGDGYTGDAKHYKKHRIHSIKQKADLLYKDDIIIFTKVKGTHYEPCNVLVTLTLKQFNMLLKCKRIAQKVVHPDIEDKIKDMYNIPDSTLSDLKYRLNIQIKICKSTLTRMNSLIKKIK